MSARRSLTIALHAAMVLLAGQLLASTAAQARFVWGVNGHPLVSYPGVPFAEQLDALRDMGLTSYRVDVPGEEKIEGLAELVTEAKARGIAILPVVTPSFDLDKETPATLEKKAYDLAYALVARFKGDIEVWELGNELDNYAVIKRCEARDDGSRQICLLGDASGRSAKDYSKARWAKASAVLKGLTEGAHAADPSVKRAIGTAGWGHIGAFELMKADGLSWEISIWHMYEQDPEWAFKELAKYGHPIWVTEFNNPLGSQRGKEVQVKGLQKWMARLSELAKTYPVEGAHIYELMDEPYWGPDFESFMGLIEMKKGEGGKWQAADKKPAYAAVKEYIERIGARPAREVSVRRRCEMKPAPGSAVGEAQVSVAYAYCLVLGREADGGGLAAYASRLGGDLSIEQVMVEMMDSGEFAQFYDVPQLTAREYVTLMHRLLLGSDPGAEALAKGAAHLEAKKPRAELQRALIDSAEFHERHPVLFGKPAPVTETAALHKAATPTPEVQRSCDPKVVKRPLEFERGQVIYSYCLVLGRWPDWIGLKSWVDEMRGGMPLKRFLLGLLVSEEFEKKYTIGSLDNAAFVTLVFQLLLDRAPDAGGLQSYVSQLANGALSRSQFYEAILDSDEFRTKQEALFTAQKPERPRADAGDGQR